MKIFRVMLVCLLAGGIGISCLFQVPRVKAAEAEAAVPSIIEDGFVAWVKKGPSYAMETWKKGGLLDGERKPSTLAAYFNHIDRSLGKYKTFELVDTKRISGSSQVVYVSINFERAAAYGRFLVYRTDNGWVIQNMDFSLRPETLMPWLSFTGESYSE